MTQQFILKHIFQSIFSAKHYCHFSSGNFVMGAVLCLIGYLEYRWSLPTRNQQHPPNYDNQKCSHTLPNILWGQNHSRLRTTCPREIFIHIHLYMFKMFIAAWYIIVKNINKILEATQITINDEQDKLCHRMEYDTII